ncbi:MAG: hypothetical protein ACPMAG_12210, partial [Limisphaerales bacterium]
QQTLPAMNSNRLISAHILGLSRISSPHLNHTDASYNFAFFLQMLKYHLQGALLTIAVEAD